MSRKMLGVVALKVLNTRFSFGSLVRLRQQAVQHAGHLGGLAALEVLQLVFEAAAGRRGR